jgi:proline iminopeptidase
MIQRLVAALALLLLPLAAHAQSPLAPGEHRETINGVALWYRVAGQPTGTPVIFLHGGPGEGSETFATFAGPPLERSLRMVYLDQRGSGRSERPSSNAYSIALLVDDIEQLRQRLGVDRIALIGHSFGTVLALEYAARYPDRVAGIVLAAAVPDLPAALDIQCARLEAADPAAFARAAEGIAPGTSPHCDAFNAYEGPAMKDYVYANMFPDPATGRLVDETDAAGGKNTGELSAAIFSQGFLHYRFADRAALTMPLLDIAGGKDFQAVVESQRALVVDLPDARLLVYPDNGHFMFVEDPERFARDVSAFLGPLVSE